MVPIRAAMPRSPRRSSRAGAMTRSRKMRRPASGAGDAPMTTRPPGACARADEEEPRMRRATTTTTAQAVPPVPRASALAELDAAEQRARDAAEATVHAKVDTRRQAALADARTALEAWRTL